MKFIRLTSVFLCCALLSLFLILPVSAADDDNYYSLAPVSSSEPSSAVDYPINPAEFSDSDSTVLSSILHFVQFITTSPSSYQPRSIIGMLDRIGELVYQISHNFGGFDGVATESTLSAISDKVATESTLSSFFDFWKLSFSDYFNTNSGSFAKSWNTIFTDKSYFFPTAVDENGVAISFYKDSWFSVIGNIYGTLFQDYKTANTGQWSFYHYVKRLADVLANDDDLAMRESQKENVDQIKKDFVSGTSGKTSLGKDDFGSLSSVGGTFKDISSLNGQASLDSFSSGLTDADTAGQGWFSQSTKDALDSVSGSTTSDSTVSTFSDDGLSSVDVDLDPYNMGNFEDNYSWLWGEK